MNNKKKIIIIFLASILAILIALMFFKTETKKTIETTPAHEEIIEQEEVVEVIEPSSEEPEQEANNTTTTKIEKQKPTKAIETNENTKAILQGTVDTEAETQDDGLININFSRVEDPSEIIITKEYNKPKPRKYIFK